MTEILYIGLLLSFFAVMLLILIHSSIHSNPEIKPKTKKSFLLKFWERFRSNKGIGIEKNEDKT